jgi:uncharacterized surface protein with fasciclin (FAS1) repeats
MVRKLMLLAIAVLLSLTLLPGAAPRTAQARDTIVDIAASDGRFTILVAALQATGLDEVLATGGPFTVFAPTDAAFSNVLRLLGIGASDLLGNPELADILLYHVVSGAVTSDIAAGLTSATTVEGSNLRIGQGGPLGIQLNGASNVIIADIIASNGVIHVIDNVLWPPTNILGLARQNELSIFLEALEAADLTSALLGAGPYTVLVPTNTAFANLLGALGLTKEQLFAETELLTSVLLYHVIAGAVTSDTVVTLSSARTLNGASIAINGTTFNDGQARVVRADLIGRNGVLHIIDGVLLPPQPASAAHGR